MDAAARQGIEDNFADKVESDIHAKNNNERNQINAEKSNAMNEAVTAMNAAGVAGKTSESAINNFKSSSTALAAANESFERASAKSDVLKNDSVKDSIQNNGSISPEIASDYRSKMESAAQVRDEKAATHAAIMNDSNSTAEAKMASANELKAAQESYESSARQYNAVSSINSEISKSGAANGVDAYAKVSSSTGEELKAATTNRESAQVAYNAAAQEVSNVASTAQAVWNDSAVSNDVKAHGSISDATMEGIATQYGADSTQYEMAQSLNEKAASIKNANPSASNDAVYDTVSKGVNNLATSGSDNILTSSMDAFNKSSEKMAFVDTQEAAMQTSAREDIRAGFKAIDKSYNDFAHSDGADNEIDTFKQYQASISAMENTVSKYVSPESAEQTFHERYGDATKEYANEVRNASRQMWNDVESSGALSDPAMNQYAKKILHSEGATDATLDFDDTTGVLTGRVYNRTEIKDSEGNVTGARESYTTYNDVRGTVTDSSGEEKLGYVSKVDYTTTSSASNPNFATVTISDGNGEFFKPTGLTERGSDGHYRLKPEFEGRVPISVYDDGQNGVGASMNLNISFDGRQDVDGNNVVRVGVAGAKDGSFVEYHGKDLTAESMAERIRTGDFSNIEAKTTNGPQNSMLMQILRNSSRRMGRPKMGRRRNSNINKTYKSNKK